MEIWTIGYMVVIREHAHCYHFLGVVAKIKYILHGKKDSQALRATKSINAGRACSRK